MELNESMMKMSLIMAIYRLYGSGIGALMVEAAGKLESIRIRVTRNKKGESEYSIHIS